MSETTDAFTDFDSAGRLLTKELDRGGKALAPVDVLKAFFNPALPGINGC